MKFLKSAAYALMASQLTAAAPAAAQPSTDIIEYRTLNEAHAVLLTLDKRLRCETLSQTLRTISTSGIM
ncbi:hypothetical protein DHEL01_v212378 [Diaporthe helianthi]|uniref:Uncharacterized protein n=1 Tax=Diaporthe helianthi TaxID=158607 RepID=A0A2P5HG55_DIAHE|nr:hypothetical protein DHEL01_v212378 [Diaporthe helianthi]